MALETLKGINEIGGFKVLQERPYKKDGTIDWDKFDELRKTQPIYIDNAVNMISFRIQKGPIRENGINGCQVDTLVETAKLIVESLNENFPSEFNYQAIKGLEDCLQAFADRKADREKRGVEGMNLR